VVNATTITCTTQARAAGPCSVQIVTPVGTNVANTHYSYKAVTTTSLTSTGATAPYGSAFPVTVTVNATNPYAAPIGSVSLKEGATNVATRTLATPGTWTFSPLGLSVGTHTLTAQYDGDAWNLRSTSAGSFTFNVTQATGMLALTSSLNPMLQSDPVTFTATLTPPLSGVTITFKDGTTSLGSAVTNSLGVAVFSPELPMPYGSRSITAVFAPVGPSNVSTATSPVLTQTVNQNANAIVLTNLTQSYDGTPKSPTAITVPSGRTVNFTYTGTSLPASTAPTNAGTYGVTGTISDPVWGGTASGTFTINKGNATITIAGTNRFIDGTPKPVTVTTVPAGLSYTLTYNGSTTAPSALGSYAVAVTVNNPNWAGSATDTLNISNAAVTTTTLTSSQNPSIFLTQPTFTARATSATAGLNGQMALFIDNMLFESKPVDANGYATFTPPADKLRGGARTVRAVYNGNFAVVEFASSNATITQTVNKLTWPVTLGSLSQVYDGNARAATANVAPPPTHTNVQVDFTYDGSPVVPVNAGTYAVVGTINDPSLQGTASSTLIVAKAPAQLGVLTPAAVGFDGLPHPVELAPSPELSASITYQSLVNDVLTDPVTATPPSAMGSYRAFLSHPNYALNPPTTDFTITGRGVSIVLGGLSVIGDGSPKPVTVVTDPPGINVAVTYQDGNNPPTTTAPSTPPTSGEFWKVATTVTEANHFGTAQANLSIRVRQQAVITVDGLSTVYPGRTTYTVKMPTGISGFAPPGQITFKQDGVSVGTAPLNVNGSCTWSPLLEYRATAYSLTAEYEGDADYFPAISSTQLTTVIKRTVIVRPTIAGPLIFTYNGLRRWIPFTTNFSDGTSIKLFVTYGGLTTAPVDVTGNPVYVTAYVNPDDPNYEGTVTVPMWITKAPATIKLGGLDHIHRTGVTGYSATATTEPPGIPVEFTYNGSLTPPSTVGEYTVQARPLHQRDRDNYEVPPVTGTLRVISSQVVFDVTGPTAFLYDGNTKGLSITATPAIRYGVLYNGSLNRPNAAGDYEVKIYADQPPFSGSITHNLNIVGSISASSTAGTQSKVGTFKLNGTEYLEPGATGAFPNLPVWRPAGTVNLEFVGRDTANERFRFKQWEDGNKDNPRTVVIGGPEHPGTGTYKAVTVHEANLIGTSSPPEGAKVNGGGWKAAGDIASFQAFYEEGYCVVDWIYNNTIHPVKFTPGTRTPELLIKVVPGGGSPVAVCVPGYIAEAVPQHYSRGTAKCVRTDRRFEETPVQRMSVPKTARFTAIATPAPGFRFEKWILKGAKSPYSGNSAVHSLKFPEIELEHTADYAEATAQFVTDKPAFDANVDSTKLVGSIGNGSYNLVTCRISLTNVGGKTAEEVEVTGVTVTSITLGRRGGGQDHYYPNPQTAQEQAANAQLSADLQDRLRRAIPTALIPPYDYGYLVQKASSDYPIEFEWPPNFSPTPDHTRADVNFKLNITYEGGSTTSWCSTNLRIE
jgi:hypothetical protein